MKQTTQHSSILERGSFKDVQLRVPLNDARTDLEAITVGLPAATTSFNANLGREILGVSEAFDF